MDGDDKMTPVELVTKWLIANGKEAIAFTIVMAAAWFMFNDVRDESKLQRVDAAAQKQRDIDRETKAWHHAKEMKDEMAGLREAIKELTRVAKGAN